MQIYLYIISRSISRKNMSRRGFRSRTNRTKDTLTYCSILYHFSVTRQPRHGNFGHGVPLWGLALGGWWCWAFHGLAQKNHWHVGLVDMFHRSMTFEDLKWLAKCSTSAVSTCFNLHTTVRPFGSRVQGFGKVQTALRRRREGHQRICRTPCCRELAQDHLYRKQSAWMETTMTYNDIWFKVTISSARFERDAIENAEIMMQEEMKNDTENRAQFWARMELRWLVVFWHLVIANGWWCQASHGSCVGQRHKFQKDETFKTKVRPLLPGGWCQTIPKPNCFWVVLLLCYALLFFHEAGWNPWNGNPDPGWPISPSSRGYKFVKHMFCSTFFFDFDQVMVTTFASQTGIAMATWMSCWQKIIPFGFTRGFRETLSRSTSWWRISLSGTVLKLQTGMVTGSCLILIFFSVSVCGFCSTTGGSSKLYVPYTSCSKFSL